MGVLLCCRTGTIKQLNAETSFANLNKIRPKLTVNSLLLTASITRTNCITLSLLAQGSQINICFELLYLHPRSICIETSVLITIPAERQGLSVFVKSFLCSVPNIYVCVYIWMNDLHFQCNNQNFGWYAFRKVASGNWNGPWSPCFISLCDRGMHIVLFLLH
jgi:hypothetical protein